VPAGHLLSQILGVPCYLEKDLHLAALGYYHFFATGTLQHMAYVSVGTGVAAGLILDGRLYRGAHGMAGEFGHMVVDPQGLRCNCGNRGCLETFTAGPAIVRAGQEAVRDGRMTFPAELAEMTAVDVFDAAKSGNPAAQEIIHVVGSYLGRGLQALMMSYDVDKIILGGGIARAGDIFLNAILHEWQQQASLSLLAAEMLKPEKVELVPPEVNAGAWGGVALARDRTVQATPDQLTKNTRR
jgi:glucokinase